MSEATKKPAPVLSQRETEVLIAALQNVKSGDIQVSGRSRPATKPCTRFVPMHTTMSHVPEAFFL